MIITFCGTPGSGKSSIAEELTQKLGYTRIYIGGIRRELAKKKGLTLDELNKRGETDPSTDYEADEIMKKVVYDMDNLIIEGRTAAGLFRKWGIEKDTLHIYVKCSIEEGARRIFEQKKKEGNKRNETLVNTIEDEIKEIKSRMQSDTKRYMKYYNFNCYDERLYDIIIDTTKMNKKEQYEAVYHAIQKEAKKRFHKDI